MDKKYIVALELSGTQIKGSVASVDADPTAQVVIPTICALVSEDSTDCVQYGRVQNLINAAKCSSAVLQKLNKVPTIADGKIVAAYVGLSGRSLGSEQASAMIELPNETEITPEILKSLFVEAAKRAAPSKKVLRVLPRKYVVDNQSMLNPVGALGYKLRGDFTIVTCNPTIQRNLDMVLKERVGLNVDKYIVTPLALADMVLGEEEKQLGCVLIDLGSQTTTISIYKDRALQYLATLPIGSHNITRDISQGLNMTMERAETLKCTIGDAMAPPAKGTDETSRVNNYVVARAYELAVNIVANIGYAGYDTTALPGGLILSGRGSRLHNFDNLLANQSKMRVRSASLPDVLDFNLDRSIVPEEYQSLLAIVLRVSRTRNFIDCVSFPQPEPEVVPEEPIPAVHQPYVPPTVTPAPQQQPANITPQPVNKPVAPHFPKADSVEKWTNDDPLPEEKNQTPDNNEPAPEKIKKNRPGLLDRIKGKWERLISSEGLEDDAQI